MNPNITWIEAVYGSGENRTHVAVPEKARASLLEMSADLVDTNQHVALYVPESTGEVYTQGAAKRGRIICLAQFLPMPSNGRVEDYFDNDWDGSRRWPIGWPARPVCAPPVADCPTLREHVESLFGAHSFASYTGRFQKGPFRLEPAMQERLNRDFARFPPFQ